MGNIAGNFLWRGKAGINAQAFIWDTNDDSKFLLGLTIVSLGSVIR